jgi:hypothetical protein
MKTTAIDTVAAVAANAICFVPFAAASAGRSPRSRCRSHGVQGEAEQPEHAEGRDQRGRDGEAHDHSRPPASQEGEDRDRGQDGAELEGEERLVHGFADRLGEVGDPLAFLELHARRQGGLHGADAALHLVGDRHRVAAGLLHDPDPDRGPAVVAGELAQVLGAVLHPRHVAQQDRRAVRVGHDEIGQLLEGAELRLGLHRVLDLAALDEAAGDLDVLPAQGGEHVRRREPPRPQPLAVEPDADVAIRASEDDHRGHAVDRLELRLHHPTHELGGLHRRAVAVERDPHDRVVARVHLVDDRRLELWRQLEAGPIDLGLDVLARQIDVAPQLELDHDDRGPLAGGGAQLAHARDGVDLLLEDVGDVLLHHLGIGALHDRGHHHGRELHPGSPSLRRRPSRARASRS